MRKLLLVVLVVVALSLITFAVLRVGPAPTIAIEPAAPVIGQRTPITVRVSEPKRGLSNIKVEVAQGDAVRTLSERPHEPASAWSPWRKGTASDEIRVEVGKEVMPDLKSGSAIVRVTARR